MNTAFATVNPATGERLKTYSYWNASVVEAELTRLQKTSETWRRSHFSQRRLLLEKLAQELRHEAESLAKEMALEMGKPLREGRSEVEKCAQACWHYATHGESYLQTEPILDGSWRAQMVPEPMGIILAIMPWNFPLWQVIRFLAPTLAVGNVALLKHSDLVAGSAELLEKVIQRAADQSSLPCPLRWANVSHEQTSLLIADPRIRAVTLTGSTRAGATVAALAGQSLKKCVLELGGSDPYLIFEDADLDQAVQVCADSRLQNNGQSCVAAKRFFVHRSLRDPFLTKLQVAFASRQLGDPLNPSTDLGPLASAKFSEALRVQVQKLKQEGWQSWSTAKTPTSSIAFFAPQILTAPGDALGIWDQEFFGPVACVWFFDDEDRALQQANSSIFGLGAALFSRDVKRIQDLAAGLECGVVGLNEMVRSDARWTFGGVKQSGYGRELSRAGLLEFVSWKSILGTAT